MTTDPKPHWTPSQEFAHHAPALVCQVASRVVWLRKKVEEFPPEIRAQLTQFIAPLPFEKELLSGKIEEVEKARVSDGSEELRPFLTTPSDILVCAFWSDKLDEYGPTGRIAELIHAEMNARGEGGKGGGMTQAQQDAIEAIRKLMREHFDTALFVYEVEDQNTDLGWHMSYFGAGGHAASIGLARYAEHAMLNPENDDED